MPNIGEVLKQAKQRVNPEGLAVSGTLAGASILAIPSLQAAITYGIHELSKEVPTDTIKLASVGMIAIANVASILMESRTLRKQNYSSSPLASTLNVATGQSEISSTAGHAVNFAQSYGINPVHLVSTAALLAGDEGRLFAENAAGVGLALGIWNIGFNALISSNRVEPVINKMRDLRSRISRVNE